MKQQTFSDIFMGRYADNRDYIWRAQRKYAGGDACETLSYNSDRLKNPQ